MTKFMINNLIEMAKNGEVLLPTNDGGYWKFNTKFFMQFNNQDIENYDGPVIKIANSDNFYALIEKYIGKAKTFYDDNQKYFDLTDNAIEQQLFLNMMLNCTNYDFNNIEQYIVNRTKMIDRDLTELKPNIAKFDNYDVSYRISKNRSNLEGPFKIEILFQNEQENFLLPEICFGMVDNVCNIFAVQNKQCKEKTDISKKLDRYFRKTNKDVDQQDIVANISTNALVSLTIFNAILYKKGVTQIEAPVYLPIRNNSSEIVGLNKQKTEQDKEQFEQTYDRISYNTINKFMYLFKRYQHHFDKTDCDFNPDYDRMEITINPQPTDPDNIISSISDCIINSKSLDKQIIENDSLQLSK